MKSPKSRNRLAGAAVFFFSMMGVLGMTNPSEALACPTCVAEPAECSDGPNQLCKTEETCFGAGSTKKCTTNYYYYH